MSREYVIRVRLKAEELAAFDDAAARAGLTRPRWLCRLIVGGADGEARTPSRVEAFEGEQAGSAMSRAGEGLG